MSNEMNEAYRKSIVVLSELMQGEVSMGSTKGKASSFATDQSTKGKLARQRMNVLSRRSGQRQTNKFKPGGPQLAHTHPTPGPSLHEDYLRMAELMVEKRTAAMVAAGLSCFAGSCKSVDQGVTAERPAVVHQEKAAKSGSKGRWTPPGKTGNVAAARNKAAKAEHDKRSKNLTVGGVTNPSKPFNPLTQDPKEFADKHFPKPKTSVDTKGAYDYGTLPGRSALTGTADALKGLRGNLQRGEEIKKRAKEFLKDGPKGKKVNKVKGPKTGPGKKGGSYGKDFRKGRSAAKTVRGKPIKSHTDAPEGPSLHEEYSDLVSILMEKVKSKTEKDYKRLRSLHRTGKGGSAEAQDITHKLIKQRAGERETGQGTDWSGRRVGRGTSHLNNPLRPWLTFGDDDIGSEKPTKATGKTTKPSADLRLKRLDTKRK